MSHTPGPWECESEYTEVDGEYVEPRIFSHAYPDNPQYVASIAVRGNMKENGSLIAAAPELLATLQTIADFAVGNGDVCEIIAGRARAAIAKAEGH